MGSRSKDSQRKNKPQIPAGRSRPRAQPCPMARKQRWEAAPSPLLQPPSRCLPPSKPPSSLHAVLRVSQPALPTCCRPSPGAVATASPLPAPALRLFAPKMLPMARTSPQPSAAPGLVGTFSAPIREAEMLLPKQQCFWPSSRATML